VLNDGIGICSSGGISQSSLGADGWSPQGSFSGHADLVVLRLMLPKFAGADVLKFIRADPRAEDRSDYYFLL